MLTSSLQENIICLLAYHDKYASIVRSSIELTLYGGPYRTIASRCYDYIDKYKQPPKDHLPDILSDKLSDGTAEAKLYIDIVDQIHSTQEGLNTEYVINQLELFIKRQSLRSIAVELTKALQKDTEETLIQAEELIAKANQQTLKVFDPGTRLSDKQRSLSFIDTKNDCLPTGIPELDKRGFGPTRKEVWLFIGNAKAGKTFALMHLAKMALMHRYKVCHISLEMSEKRCAQRYFQGLFAVSKHLGILQTTKFKYDDQGRIIGFDDVQMTPKFSLEDEGIRGKLEKVIDKWAVRLLDNIFIKEFPTSTLTMHKLRAYLDSLEATQQFVPDLLIVDYPDLMKLDKNNLRLSIDEIYKELRGLAGERNIAVAIVSQSNRGSSKAKSVGVDNVAEAYSKIAHADCIVTYSATESERKLGLARLHVTGRNDADNLTVVISQQYGIGNFVVDSAVMNNWYHTDMVGKDD
jgi:replicative DNA helicase